MSFIVVQPCIYKFIAVIYKKTSELSLGQKRRLALALAFANKPDLIFLDEPTVGLDVESRHAIWSFIKNYCASSKITLFLTTHYLEEAEVLADRIIYLQKGVIQSDSKTQDFISQMAHARVEFDCHQAFDSQCLKDFSNRIDHQDSHYCLYCQDSDFTIRRLVECKVPFSKLQVYQPTLEEAYLQRQQEGARSC